MKKIVTLFLVGIATVVPAQRPAGPASTPRLAQRDGRYALMVDGAPYLMLGAQVNNSSAWPQMLSKVWPTANILGINTLEVPVYWEQFEPEEGHFDTTSVQALLTGARQNHLRLVLLWFGTWKNGSGHYIPASLKRNEEHAPHVVRADGKKVDSLSPHSSSLLAADTAAFVALMRFLKAADPQHTVIMVQVENEAGTYGSRRDHSAAAEKLFHQPVPATLLQALNRKDAGGKDWPDVFGDEADEVFHAWSIASFIEHVASAGKKILPLPMYVNVALRDPFHPATPCTYECGGPTDNVISVWKAAAPSIDLIGPDIYNSGFRFYTRILELYARPDNAMFVPETGNAPGYARFFFAALGHGAIGFSPFGMDSTGYVNYPLGAKAVGAEQLAPFALNNSIFAPMSREIAKLNWEGRLQAVAEDPDQHTQAMDFGAWKVAVSYGLPQFGAGSPAPGNTPPSGGAMVAQLGPDEFLVTGNFARVEFSSASGQRQFLKVEEGTYGNGTWHPVRIWNGDQTDYGLNFTGTPQVLRVTLSTF
ncbi:MAG: DUF5597 domain-containing protein [Acidobacteriota bacterium]|nr:DUF5597 domain-containing protein [Acidobacteriota bacterium]